MADQFDIITSNAGGGSAGVINTERQAQAKKKLVFANMSTEDLERFLAKLKDRLTFGIGASQKRRMQRKIDEIEKELLKRRANEKPPVVEDVKSEKTQAKIGAVGSNVGFGALIVGVLGYLVGSTMNGKKAIWWGLGGAVAGGLGAYSLTKMAQNAGRQSAPEPLKEEKKEETK